MEQWKASLQDGQAHHAGIEEHLGDVVHLRESGSDLAKYWIMHKNTMKESVELGSNLNGMLPK